MAKKKAKKKKTTKKAAKKKTTKKKATKKKKTTKKKATKKKGTKKKAKKAAQKEMLVVTSKVKAYIKSKGLMTSSDAVEAINDKIYAMIDDAAARTESNRRSTVKPQDL
ncbi:hypothetical protein STSP2_01762 [Anaerohalosphaera lusitana]|uniref:Uncharacterized protein n=1 Tax=Anaerohalosphaera lusitana TaxID=1936003 RepID=A0A1U9NLH9_9BACT|nr:hypothetical protein [Anaerohalosphaera lusitana]AQT68594.1 hypothetical protein STSP2_01762 [Anaerohalosphaera lusitana]